MASAAGANAHLAPAGASYETIEDAGKTLLKTNVAGFYNSASSAILPPLFANVYTEALDNSGEITNNPQISTSDPRLTGLRTNLSGENMEMNFHNRLSKFLHEYAGTPLLFLQGFKLSKTKFDVLKSEYRTAAKDIKAFQKAHKQGEADFTVVAQGLGIAHLEIKRDSSQRSIDKVS